jgi:hypothetical protein
MGRDDQFSLAADLHTLHTLVPSFDDPPRTQREGKGLATLK